MPDELAVGNATYPPKTFEVPHTGGFHPNMAARLAALPVDASPEESKEPVRLRRPFPVHAPTTAFHTEVAIRCGQWQAVHSTMAEVPVAVRAEIRKSIARENFSKRLGRAPSELELSSEVARLSDDATTACAGDDMAFPPVKSVSAL